MDGAHPVEPRADDERRHDRDGSAAGPEAWAFGAGPGAGAPALSLRVALDAALGAATFTALVRPEPTVAVLVVAWDLPLPPGRALELRGPGLWADHNVEEPLARWSLGLEAFGVAVEVDGTAAIDDLLVAHARPELRGERTAVGWDLEWHTDGPIDRWTTPAASGGPAHHGCSMVCRVEGEVLLGPDRLELDVDGHRAHDWWTRPGAGPPRG